MEHGSQLYCLFKIHRVTVNIRYFLHTNKHNLIEKYGMHCLHRHSTNKFVSFNQHMYILELWI